MKGNWMMLLMRFVLYTVVFIMRLNMSKEPIAYSILLLWPSQFKHANAYAWPTWISECTNQFAVILAFQGRSATVHNTVRPAVSFRCNTRCWGVSKHSVFKYSDLEAKSKAVFIIRPCVAWAISFRTTEFNFTLRLSRSIRGTKILLQHFLWNM